MKIILFIFLFVSVTLCSVGVDVSAAVSATAFSCLVKQGYTFAIVRCYRESGEVDSNCANNVANAHAGGMDNVDLYMFPCASCGNGGSQMVTLASYIRNNNINYGKLWLDIESSDWGSVSENQQFFHELTNGTSDLSLGVYTSESQWSTIMGNSFTAGSNYPLWYAHYDSVQSFSDFSSFAGWSNPTMKQYNGNVNSPCGVGIDENWIPGGSDTTTSAASNSNSNSNSNSGPATHATSHSASTGNSGNSGNSGSGNSGSGNSGSGNSGSGNSGSGDSGSGNSGSGNSGNGNSNSGNSNANSGTTYSSGGSSSSGSSGSGEFSLSSIYNAKLGGNKWTPSAPKRAETKKKNLIPKWKLQEIDDTTEEHFQLYEEKKSNKF